MYVFTYIVILHIMWFVYFFVRVQVVTPVLYFVTIFGSGRETFCTGEGTSLLVIELKLLLVYEKKDKLK